MLQIIIADDHAVVRTGLQFIFDATHIVILDITMPGPDAFDILEQIKNQYPKMPVVIFTMNSDRNFALRMFKKGADAFINKESSPDLLLQAIRTVAQGKKFQTQEQIEMIMNHISDKNTTQNSRHDSLSDREFQILCMLASGMKKLEIASNLSISKNTVNNHRNNIMKKMEFETTADLTRYALNNRLIG